MLRHLKIVLSLISLCIVLVAMSTAYGAGRTVARVTDLEGTATVEVDGEAGDLRILARVHQGASILLGEGSRITLHFPAVRTDFKFFGPATVRVLQQTAIGNNGVAEKKQHGDIGVSLDLSRSDLGGIIARSIKVEDPQIVLQHPSRSKVVAGRPLVFSWSSRSHGAVYDLTLQDAFGAKLFSGSTADTTMKLPAGTSLEIGATYVWSVAANDSGGSKWSKSAQFITASKQETDRFYQLSALTRGDISDLVLYALHLDQMQLKTESEKIWQHLESFRPGISRQQL